MSADPNQHHDPLSRVEQAAAGTNYAPDAFLFVLHGINSFVLDPHNSGGHVTGGDLCWRLRDLALLQFGPRALEPLHRWNVFNCEDFGNIVYRMIEFDLIRKLPTQSQDEFKGVYLFEDEFTEGSRPNWRPPQPLRFGLASLFVLITVCAIVFAGISRQGFPGAIVTTSASWLGLIGAALVYSSIKEWGRGSVLGIVMGIVFLAGGLFLFLLAII